MQKNIFPKRRFTVFARRMKGDASSTVRASCPSRTVLALLLAIAACSTARAESYCFRVSKMRIDNTRARHNDTLYVTATAKVGGTVIGPVSRFMGDKNNGTHAIALSVGPFEVKDPSTPVMLEYLIVNKGHGGSGEVAFENALKAVAAKVVIGALGAGPGGIAVAIASELGLGQLLNPNCDGPVAITKIEVTGAMLRQWTATGTHVEDRFDPGYDSRDTCGSNSKYTVTWAVDKISTGSQARPDLNALRVKGDRPEQYLMDQGCRRHIPDISTRDRLFRDEAYEPMPQGEIETICEGAPIAKDAKLVRAEGQREVYLLDAGVKRHITSPAAMDKYRFSWNNIQSISPSQLGQIPAGSPID